MKFELLAALVLTTFLSVAVMVPPAFAAAPVEASTEMPDASDVKRGKRLYDRFCAVCHGAAGAGGLGPSLKGSAARLSVEQATAQIIEPKATMPRFYPNTLSEADVRDVVSYVLTL